MMKNENNKKPLIFSEEAKLFAEETAVQNQTLVFGECDCISTELRRAAIDDKIVAEMKALGKDSVTVLSIGSGALGGEWFISQALAEEGIAVNWLLVDPKYNPMHQKNDSLGLEYNALTHFKAFLPDNGSQLLGAYTDMRGYVLFTQGSAGLAQYQYGEFPELQYAKDEYPNITFPNSMLNSPSFDIVSEPRKYSDFKTNPLPTVDLVLCIDFNQSLVNDYDTIADDTHSMIVDVAKNLCPDAYRLAVFRSEKMRSCETTTKPDEIECYWLSPKNEYKPDKPGI